MSENPIDIPVIKTFFINAKPYVYDTYKNQVLSISKEHYYEIKELEKIGVSKYLDNAKTTQEYFDICLLIKKGYFKSQFINEIIHPGTRFLQYMLERGVYDLILQVTRDCNFKCRYCSYTRSCNIDRTHEPTNMSWEIAKSSVDFLYDHSKDLETVTISFYGGEPLINFDLIKAVVTYAESRFETKKIEYFMTTNASLLNDSIIDFLISNRFHLSISFDGSEEKQNSHRRFYNTGNSTFNVVVKNIAKIRDKDSKYFNKYVRILSVIFNDEVYDDALSFLTGIGVKKENVSYVYASMKGVDYISCDNITTETNKDFYDKKTKEHLDDMNEIFFDKKPIPESWHHNGPCIPGVYRLFVNIYGEFFPCEKIIESECSVIGNLDKGFDVDRIQSCINVGELTEKECKKCWAMRFCSICVSSCIDVSKQCIGVDIKKRNCDFQRDQAKEYLKDYILHKQEVNGNE